MKNSHSKSRAVAYGGVLTALIVVLLYLSTVFSFLDAVFWIIASVVIGFSLCELGLKASVWVYVASSIVSFLIVPNIFANLSYAFFFGIIPIVYHLIETKNRVFKIVFLTILAFIYTIVTYFLIGRFYPQFFNDVKFPVAILLFFFIIYYPAYKRIFTNISFLVKRGR